MISANDFLVRFFGEGNSIWPGADPSNPVAPHLSMFLDALERPGECPVMLPRQVLVAKPNVWYVIAHDSAHVERVRLLLQASVAHSWVPFNGRVAHLDYSDPVDHAVLDFRGPATTFILKPSTPDAEQRMVRALRRLAASLAARELRVPHVPRPVGRILKEFELHLATGSADGSARILSEIESIGGISHENIAFLRLRRLARLGLDEELLSSPSLPSLVYSEPPFLVREAVLGAWARRQVLPVLDTKGEEAAREVVVSAPIDIAMLVDIRSAGSSDPDVARVSDFVLALRAGTGTAPDPVEDPSALISECAGKSESGGSAASTTHQAVVELPDVSVDETSTSLEGEGVVGPQGWLEWVAALAVDPQTELDLNAVDSWAPPWTVDTELAAAINELPSLAEDALLSGVAALLHTDDADHACPRTARALLDWYLVAERFSPLDLSVLCRLLQVVIRSAPDEMAYEELLADIRAYSGRWVSISNAVRALDVADVVACGPAGDARDSFVSAILAPLNHQRSRLPESMRAVADIVTSDLGIDFNWQVPMPAGKDEQDPSSQSISPRVLIYSLDGGTLNRSAQAVAMQWPNAKIELSSATVASDSLRHQARNSDIVVLATRRATHAATRFIVQNKGASTRLEYADGCGSASMLRAVEAGIGAWVG